MHDVAIVGIGMHEFGRHDGISGMDQGVVCLLYTSPSPRDGLLSRMPSSA